MNYLPCFEFGRNLRPELCTYLLLDPEKNEQVIHVDYTESERKESLIKRTTPRLVSGKDNETEIRSTEKGFFLMCREGWWQHQVKN